MRISKQDLEKMNDLVGKGKTIADISKQFDKYDYWEIYWEVEDYSFLGKKRSISNRLKKLEKDQSKPERIKLINEIRQLLNGLYQTSKKNGKKLIDMGKILSK